MSTRLSSSRSIITTNPTPTSTTTRDDLDDVQIVDDVQTLITTASALTTVPPGLATTTTAANDANSATTTIDNNYNCNNNNNNDLTTSNVFIKPTSTTTTTTNNTNTIRESNYGPVIIHQRFHKTRIEDLLAAQGLRVRVSSSALEGTVIWPKARVAFMELDISALAAAAAVAPTSAGSTINGTTGGFKAPQQPSPSLLLSTSSSSSSSSASSSSRLTRCTTECAVNDDVISRIDRFIARHAHCHVILRSGLFTADQFKIVGLLNTRYIGTKTDFLLAHNAEDCVNAMLAIVMLQVPPHSNRQHARFCDVMTKLMAIQN